MTSAEIREMARACGFELAGVAAASPAPQSERYRAWAEAGYAGAMGYLTDRRAEIREDARRLLPSARSVVCVGRLYNTPWPYSTRYTEPQLAWISRYAWGDDYHDVIRRDLAHLDAMLRERAGAGYESKICVDTAPLLERSYARMAGLGWIGRNTCLIHEGAGSWFFLGELVVSLELEPDAPPPDRCGTCRRCIDACPTAAIVPAPAGEGYAIDSRLCISYLTIELRPMTLPDGRGSDRSLGATQSEPQPSGSARQRGAIPEERRSGLGGNVFGCDICQDVCPWNRRAPYTRDEAFQPRRIAPPLAELAAISEEEFRSMFRGSPVTRSRYSGFLRNVAIAMGARGLPEFIPPLERLAESADPVVAEHARWSLEKIRLGP